MSRPRYERTYYYMPDISVKLDDHSFKRMVEELKKRYQKKYGTGNRYFDYKKCFEETGVTSDVMRHFLEENHIRLSSLYAIKDALGFKTIIKPIDSNGKEII